MSRSDHHSDYEAGQLVLFGLASIVLLVFAVDCRRLLTAGHPPADRSLSYFQNVNTARKDILVRANKSRIL